VAHDFAGMRRERLLEGIDRVEMEMADRRVGRGRTRAAPGEALLDLDLLESRAHQLVEHRRVFVEVVVPVEFGRQRIEHAYLDHDWSSFFEVARPMLPTRSRSCAERLAEKARAFPSIAPR